MLTNNECICNYELNYQVIESQLVEGRFWKILKVVKSKPDGHCIIHSTAHCLVHRYQSKCYEVYYNLLLHIRTECFRNRMVYSPILEHGVQNSLDHESENYIVNKVFKTLFGDMVPNIVANILNQDIFIIEKAAPREHFVTVVPERTTHNFIAHTGPASVRRYF